MSKLVRLNSETLTIKRTWQGAPISFGSYEKKQFLVYAVDVNKRQPCDLEPFLRSWEREYGNLSFLTHTLLRKSALSHILGDPDLCPHRVYFQCNSAKDLFNFMCGNSSEDSE